jgi:hypothetical protein
MPNSRYYPGICCGTEEKHENIRIAGLQAEILMRELQIKIRISTHSTMKFGQSHFLMKLMRRLSHPTQLFAFLNRMKGVLLKSKPNPILSLYEHFE